MVGLRATARPSRPRRPTGPCASTSAGCAPTRATRTSSRSTASARRDRPDADPSGRRSPLDPVRRRSRAPSTTPATSTPTRGSPSATDLAFVLHLGDWIYEASQTPPASQTGSRDIGRPFDPLHECETLEDYRTAVRAVPARSGRPGRQRRASRHHHGGRPRVRRRRVARRRHRAQAGAGRRRGRSAALPRSAPARSGSRSGAPTRRTRSASTGPIPLGSPRRPVHARHADAARRAGRRRRTWLGTAGRRSGPDQKAWLCEALAPLARALAAARQPVGDGPDLERRPARVRARQRS